MGFLALRPWLWHARHYHSPSRRRAIWSPGGDGDDDRVDYHGLIASDEAVGGDRRRANARRGRNTGARAPVTAYYEELNVFGTPTGAVVRAREGDPLPAAPRSVTWRCVWREMD